MSDSEIGYLCLNCERDEARVPLVALRYGGGQAWICTECLPVVIHHRHELAGKLETVARSARRDEQ